MKFKNMKFKNKAEKFEFLKKNEKSIIAEKKEKFKKAKNNLDNRVLSVKKRKSANKTTSSDIKEKAVEVEVIINTTNIKDSHDDVHFNGIWDESIKSDRPVMHLQEHKSNEFNKIIAEGEDLDVYLKEFTWKELGYSFKGSTQALIFKSVVRQERNPEMYKNYKNGWVKNHSVGMSYDKIFLALDSSEDDHKKNKEKFDKYIDLIANKDQVIKDGFFWGVTKAQFIEGSSVPSGSNFATQTLSTTERNKKKKNKKKSNQLKAVIKFLRIKL